MKRLPKVDEVVDTIEELSIGPHDDAIRGATFHAIYTDNSLSRYAPMASRRLAQPKLAEMLESSRESAFAAPPLRRDSLRP